MPEPLDQPASPLEDGLYPLLVAAEDDVVGLLAYALHRQYFADWLAGFRQEVGREPTVAELQAYTIGERLDRRLGEYRARAAEMVGRDASAPAAEVASALPVIEPAALPARSRLLTKAPDPALARRKMVAGLIVFALLVVGVILARRALGV